MVPSTLFGLRMFRSRSARPPRPRPLEVRFRPQLEALENRLAPATFTVTTTTDEYDLNALTGDPGPDGVMSLREAMLLAFYVGGNVAFDPTLFSTPQTIALSPNVRGAYGNAEISLNSGLSLSVVGPTDVNGNNLVTIDGGGINQALGGGGSWISFYDSTNATALDSASFRNLNFINCVGGGDINHLGGGAINFRGAGGLTLDHCTFTNNSVPAALFEAGINGYGGAIYINSGPASIKNCTFSNNTASLGGGAIASFGTSLTISNSTFSGNTSSGSGGRHL
jgi:predicted outer membrane repeat protein